MGENIFANISGTEPFLPAFLRQHSPNKVRPSYVCSDVTFQKQRVLFAIL